MLFFAPDAARLGVDAGACVFTGAAGARIAFDALRRRGMVFRRLLILGAGRRAWDLVHILGREGRTLGYQITFLHDPALGSVDPRLLDNSAGDIITAGPGGIREAAMRLCPDEIVVAPDERRGMDLHGLLDCKIKGFPVSEYLGFVEREVRRVDIKRIELSWLLYSDGFHMGALDRLLKRALDLAVSIIGLVLFGPFVLAAALAVKLEDGGPALYKQTRVTLHGREFQILKLRTMRIDAERSGAVWAASGDKRITRLGAFLRRTRLDELPQLINVLSGEMSFVGPRPERPEFVAMLASHLPLYHERHAAKAGLTGWAQVNYPYGASIDDARSKLSYDLYYVKNFSILFDLLIILQTARVVLWPGGGAR
jgi:sugar transferase (PEP-CTERM system associated)